MKAIYKEVMKRLFNELNTCLLGKQKFLSSKTWHMQARNKLLSSAGTDNHTFLSLDLTAWIEVCEAYVT